MRALHMVVNAMTKEAIPSVTIHDCYGSIAPHARRSNQIMREQFVRLHDYTYNWLEQILASAKRICRNLFTTNCRNYPSGGTWIYPACCNHSLLSNNKPPWTTSLRNTNFRRSCVTLWSIGFCVALWMQAAASRSPIWKRDSRPGGLINNHDDRLIKWTLLGADHMGFAKRKHECTAGELIEALRPLH